VNKASDAVIKRKKKNSPLLPFTVPNKCNNMKIPASALNILKAASLSILREVILAKTKFPSIVKIDATRGTLIVIIIKSLKFAKKYYTKMS
jgi:hypothetical protein